MIQKFRELKLTKEECIVCIISFVISLLAKGIALYPQAYSIDDYTFTIDRHHIPGINQGRFGFAVLYEFLQILGIPSGYVTPFFGFIFLVCFCWVGIIICRVWKISGNIILSSFVVLFIAIHPYQAEIFTFKISFFYATMAYFLGFLAFYFAEFKRLTFLLVIFCMAFALSINQAILNYFLLVISLSILLEILQQYKDNNFLNLYKLLANIKLLPKCASICAGVFLYFLLNRFVLYITGITLVSRFSFISFYDISTRLIQLKDLLYLLFFKSEPILPSFPKILMFILLFSVLCVITKRAYSLNKKRAIFISLAYFLLFLAILGIIGVSLVIKEWWPVPRVLSSIGIFWAGIIAFLYLNVDNKLCRAFILVCSTIIIFSFIGINNQIFTDQLRVNMRDFNKVNRMIARLESNPNFSQVKRVVIIGDNWAYKSPINTAEGDMNISAFGCSWAKIHLLNEISGYKFEPATAEEYNKAKDLYQTAPKWPEPNSITVQGNLAIIYLP